jgi:hypothetical protein
VAGPRVVSVAVELTGVSAERNLDSGNPAPLHLSSISSSRHLSPFTPVHPGSCKRPRLHGGSLPDVPESTLLILYLYPSFVCTNHHPDRSTSTDIILPGGVTLYA